MTAILLYAFSDETKIPKTKNPITAITLRICPHLKETGWEGNKAYPLTLSVSTFIDFLKTIIKSFITLLKNHLYYIRLF
jgi:hypothetical protein